MALNYIKKILLKFLKTCANAFENQFRLSMNISSFMREF